MFAAGDAHRGNNGIESNNREGGHPTTVVIRKTMQIYLFMLPILFCLFRYFLRLTRNVLTWAK